MILEKQLSNSTANVGLINLTLGLSDQTIKVVQEFLATLQSVSVITEDIPKSKPEDLNKVFYENYKLYYDTYRSKVCVEELDLYERLVNFICMSNMKVADLKSLKHLVKNYYISDNNQFNYGELECQFNVNVGVEYKIVYKNESYVGVYSNEEDPTKLKSSYTKLLSSEYLYKISDGVIKVRKFKDGSYVRFRFMFNVDSFDEVKLFINNVLNDSLFSKWQFKGVCNDEDIIKIRYIYSIKKTLQESIELAEEGVDAIKSMDFITYKCMDIVRKKMYFSSYARSDGFSSIFYEIKDFLIPLLLHYFVPEKDKEFFYKMINYVTCSTRFYSMMGYAGFEEKSKEGVKSILENRGKMERLISKILYNKSLSKKEDFVYQNAFHANKFFGITSYDQVDKIVDIITRRDSYKNFNIQEAEKDEMYLSKINDKSPFDDIGVSEETVYLSIMAINALYKIPDSKLRNEKRAELIKRAKRFINKDEYDMFGEIIVKFTSESDGLFYYLPKESMSIKVNLFKNIRDYFEDNEYIKKNRSSAMVAFIEGYASNTTLYENINDVSVVINDVERIITEGGVTELYGANKGNPVKLEDCCIVPTPYVNAFSKIPIEGDYNGEYILSKREIANIIKYVLSVDLNEIEEESVGYTAMQHTVSVQEECAAIYVNENDNLKVEDGYEDSTLGQVDTKSITTGVIYQQEQDVFVGDSVQENVCNNVSTPVDSVVEQTNISSSSSVTINQKFGWFEIVQGETKIF